MSVSQILDLRIVQPIKTMIPLALITLLILPLTVQNTANSQEADSDLSCKIDGVSLVVPWAVRFYICPASRLAILHLLSTKATDMRA